MQRGSKVLAFAASAIIALKSASRDIPLEGLEMLCMWHCPCCNALWLVHVTKVVPLSNTYFEAMTK